MQGPSGGSCTIAAIDGDKDSFGNKSCAAAPGTDCDDSNPSISPDAVEVCDGIDNDCNGKADLNDGLPLTGTAMAQAGYSDISIAWAPTTQRFVMIADKNDIETGGLYPGALSSKGVAAWSGASLTTGTASYSRPRLVWFPAESTFVFVYAAGGRGSTAADIGLMTDAGIGYGDLTLPFGAGSINPELALRAAGDVLIAYHDASNTYVSRYNGDRPEAKVTLQGEVSIAPRIATSGDLSAVVYQISGTKTINMARINASLVAGTPYQLTSNGQSPAIVGVGDSYAVAWSTAGGFDYQLMKSADGSVSCGPIHVPFGDGVLDANDELAMAATKYGVLVLATDDGGRQVSLMRLSSNCNVIDHVPAGSPLVGCSGPAIAVGEGSVALSWWEPGATGGDGYVRVMGDRLCN